MVMKGTSSLAEAGGNERRGSYVEWGRDEEEVKGGTYK